MYYQNYEDYMRTVLGYPVDGDTYFRNDNYYINQMPTYINETEIDKMYPEIYKLINPIVCDTCDEYTGNITNESLEKMVDEIYKKIELNNDIMSKINMENRTVENNRISKSTIVQSQNSSVTQNRETQKSNISQNNINEKNLSEDRQIRRDNKLLRDLIRILILNRIFGGNVPNRPPKRPPYPGSRPPYGVRPPYPPTGSIMPREEY